MSSADLSIEEEESPRDHPAPNGIGAPSNQNSSQNKFHWVRRPCLWVAIAIKWLPVAFIAGVIGWSYYAFVVALCVFTIQSIGEKVILLIIYHVILSLFVSSYFKTIFSPLSVTPTKWKLSSAMVEKLNKAKSEQEWKSLLELFVVEMELPVVQRSVQV
jgi:palmitoyltransferase